MRNCRDPVRTQHHATTRPHWCGGRRRVRRAWLRCPWAVAGPGRASRRRAEPDNSDRAPLVWRVPEGPEGQGGLRDRPLRAKLACGDLAGGRARRRPERPWGHAAKPRSNTRERVGCLAAPHPSSTPGLSTAVNQPQSINQHSLRRQRLRGADLRGPAAGQPGGDERGHDGDDAHADQL